MPETIPQVEFLDPFAENGQEAFNPIASHDQITERYLANEVEHDYTADRFVSDTQALMLDAQFAGKFEEAQMIAMRMHQMCGEDHSLQQSATANESFSDSLSGLLGDKSHDGHDHGDSHNKHSSKKDDDEIDPKTGKKKNKKRKYRWLF